MFRSIACVVLGLVIATTAPTAGALAPDPSPEAVAERLDSLESRLARLSKPEPRSPYALRESRHWGRGFGTAVTISEPGFALELSYHLVAGHFDDWLFGNLRRMGMGLGVEGPEGLDSGGSSAGSSVAPYASLRFSTHVLANFASFGSGVRWYWPAAAKQGRPVLSLSQEAHLWFPETFHLDWGVHLDLGLGASLGEAWGFRPFIGYTAMLGKQRGKWRIRPVD